MASLKIASLLLRTLSKPIATKIKQRAKDHEGFKTRTIGMAQFLHRAEMNLRVSLLGESPKHVRPLSESRAIESGANFLSEGFLFTVAATIIIGETYRSRLSESKRRDAVRDSLESHESEIEELRERLKDVEVRYDDERNRSNELSNIVEHVVQIGLKGGFGAGESLREGRENWERHLRIAELARAFGTNGRVLQEDDEEGDERVEVEETPQRVTKEEEVLRIEGEKEKTGETVTKEQDERIPTEKAQVVEPPIESKKEQKEEP
ncbi:uncharacterized protein JCM6883_001113 [Sporobolomyces salmoneus]|uniref:uncharacterized protein n=1 Tax=Sporobolomyces salmoneus TaxID=183962 RepID=UPI00316E0D06